MIEKLQITTLVENTVHQRRLLAEHGLSFLIETPEARILFDTGAGMTLFPNARELGISMSGINAVVCSHGHDDHTGALSAFLHNSRDALVVAHPAAMEPKYVRRKEGVNYIGIPQSSLSSALALGDRLLLTRESVEVAPGIHTTGEVPRETDFEDTGGAFFLDEAAETPDPMLDDQALFLETSRGLIVICGCAHSGVVNILDHVSRLTGATQIYALLGGFHLGRATSERLDRTAQAFERYRIERLSPCHCTGPRGLAYLRHRFPSHFTGISTGSTLNI
jgi:7,8-dihydropterin-6-yl-methyl-4-(beta-D-ribofuranosyl)aminobenzene 5'-phosphate synthase